MRFRICTTKILIKQMNKLCINFIYIIILCVMLFLMYKLIKFIFVSFIEAQKPIINQKIDPYEKLKIL